MIQQQQQKTSQWVLTSVQFNLVEYICSLQSDLIRILNIFVLSNLAEYEYQKIEYSYSNILYSVPIIRIFEYIRVWVKKCFKHWRVWFVLVLYSRITDIACVLVC